MAGRSFWYRVATGEEVPVEPSEDRCLPLFEKPRLFGLHEEVLDRMRHLYREEVNRKLVNLVVRSGWTLVDTDRNTNYCKVLAASEAMARSAVSRINLHSDPAWIYIETVGGRQEKGGIAIELPSRSIFLFIEGAPLHGLQQAE